MLTDLSKIGTDFEVDFGLGFQVHFEVNVGFFVLHFPASQFYKFLIEKKKNYAQHTQIETVLCELIAQNNRFFGFTFYLTT